MSDFFAGLAARSLGDAAPIRPRVPSRYEPYRPPSGLTAERIPARRLDPDAPGATDPTGNDSLLPDLLRNSAPPMPLAATPPRPEAAPAKQTRSEALAAARFTTAELAKASTHAENAGWSASPDPRAGSPPEPAEPSSNPLWRAANTPVFEPAATAPPSSLQPAHSEAELSTRMPSAAQVGGADPGTIAASLSKLGSPPVSRPDMEDAPAPRTQPNAPVPVPSSLQPGFIAHISPPANPPTTEANAGALRPANAPHPGTIERWDWPRPESAAPQTLLSSSIGPKSPGRVRSESPLPETAAPVVKGDAIVPVRASAPNLLSQPRLAPEPPAEPSVRITIGRVEVKAVFPPAPAGRAQTQRSRPAVSLDEYLKRGGTGR